MPDLSNTDDLLKSIIEAHGGLDRWNNISHLNFDYMTHGALPDLKGSPGFHVRNLELSAHEQRVVMRGSDDPGEIWHYTPHKVWIEDATGNVVDERINPREQYEGLTLLSPWNSLQWAYFRGYAYYFYFTLPWHWKVQPGLKFRELQPHREPGADEDWRVLEVTYPAETFPSHTPVERFYVGSDFLLKRMDYETDVLGGVAAHYCYDYKEIAGLKFPSQRRVVMRTPEERKGLVWEYTPFWVLTTKIRIVEKGGKIWDESSWVLP